MFKFLLISLSNMTYTHKCRIACIIDISMLAAYIYIHAIHVDSFIFSVMLANHSSDIAFVYLYEYFWLMMTSKNLLPQCQFLPLRSENLVQKLSQVQVGYC
jgi:hypothetical protein